MTDGQEGAGLLPEGRSVSRVSSTVSTWIGQNAVVRWTLYSGKRWLVALSLLAAVFVVFLGLALLRPVDMERIISETTTLRTLFAALLSGAILIVSVVSSISSIVLSEEITDVETEQERIDGTIEFHRRAETLADVESSPGQPAAFLEVLISTIHDQAKALGEVAVRSDNQEFADRVGSFVDEVLDETTASARSLDGATFGTFKVLSAGMNYDYSWQLTMTRRILNRYGDSLTDEERAVLEDLVDTLKFFGTGREYFQSLYYKREVAQLSRMLLYVSLPVIVLISYLMLALDANLLPYAQFGPLSSLSVFILFAYTVSLAPYVVLTAHVIRIAAITMQTLAAGPFTIRPDDHQDIVDLDVETDPEHWETRIDSEAQTSPDTPADSN